MERPQASPSPLTPLGAPDPSRPEPGAWGGARVLIVSGQAAWRRSAARALARAGMRCRGVGSAGAARASLRAAVRTGEEADAPADHVDVALVDLDMAGDGAVEIAALAHAAGAAVVFAGAGLRLDDAVAAMRTGACDLVAVEAPRAELVRRVGVAAGRARESRRQRERVVKLKRMCRRLNAARRRVVRQVDALCVDLVQAYQELADHMNQVTIATEFKGLIRQELDIESLLRTTLEFVLARSGPTNAAVFLPTTSGDYSLGAYVNYDCPKETADILLDHLANVVAPRFEEAHGIVHMTDRGALAQWIGDEAQWLGDSHVVAFACRHERETLAIFLLFRDRRTPFTGVLLEQFQTISELFAAQLARVIQIHHRHLPKEKWGMLGDPERGDDYGDLAA